MRAGRGAVPERCRGRDAERRARTREVNTPEPGSFDDHEVAQIVDEILRRYYVDDPEGAAREAAAHGVAIEARAATEITQVLRELLAPRPVTDRSPPGPRPRT